MFQDILNRSYYGNSPSAWLTALAIMLGAVMASRRPRSFTA